MRALIAGSTGFVGGALATSLVARGVTVHRVVRGTAAAGEVGIDAAARRLDLSGLPGGDLREVDVVFNLAGEPLTPAAGGPPRSNASARVASSPPTCWHGRSPPPRRIGCRRWSRCRPSATTATAATSCSPRRRRRGGASSPSSAAPGRRRRRPPATPARVVCCRSGIVLGAGGVLARQRPLFRAGLGGRLGSGRQWMSWIALEDVTAALWHCATEQGVSGAVNLCAPAPVRNSEFTALLAGLLHRPAFLAVPRPLLRLALGQRVTDELVIASERCVPQRLQASGYAFSEPDLAHCLATLEGARAEP